MKHATYDFKPKTRLTNTQRLSLGPKTPSNFISLLAIHIALLDPLDSIFLLVSLNPLATLGANNLLQFDGNKQLCVELHCFNMYKLNSRTVD